MRNRIKRTLAMFLALLLLVGTIFTDDLLMIRADVTTKNVTVVVPASLPGFVEGAKLNARVTVHVNDGTNINDVYTDITDGNTNTTFQVPYDEGYSYQFELTSNNYVIAASGAISNEDTDDTINVTSVTPDYSIEISGPESIYVDSNETYTATTSKADWQNMLTWSLEGVEGQDGIIFDSMNHKINASGLSGTDLVTAILKVEGPGSIEQTKSVKISKKDMGLKIKDAVGTWANITVTVTDEARTKDKIIKLFNGTEELGSKETNGSGSTTITFHGTQQQAYNLVAMYDGESDSVYRSSFSAEKSFTSGKENQEITVTPQDGSVTYGFTDAFVAIVKCDKNDSSNGYTFVTDSDEDGKDDYTASVVNKDGEEHILITPLHAGTINVKLHKNANEKYNDSNDVEFEVTVAKKTIKIDPKSVSAENRAYDGTTAVKVTASVKADDLVEGDSVFEVSSDAGEADSKNVGTRNVSATLSIPTGSEYANKYKLYNGEVKTTVKIEKATLKLVSIGDAEVVYDQRNQLTNKDVQFTYEGFVLKESSDNLKGFENPDIKIDTSVITDTTELNKFIENAIIVDKNSGNPTDNYQFDFDSYIPGKLKLLEETVEDGKFPSYVKIDNESSDRVYQAGDQYYYGVKSEVLGKPVAKFSFDGDKYDGLEVKIGNNFQPVNLDDGLELDGESPSQTFTFRLIKNEKNGRTTPFNITFIQDNSAPEATVTVGEASIPFIDYLNSITFGMFKNTQVEAEISVIDPTKDEQGLATSDSGVKEWKYYVYNPTVENSSLSEDEVKELISSFISVEGDTVTVPLGKDEEAQNYVILVLMTDNVGNTQIVGTNGIIIDNIVINAIQVTYKEGTKFTNKEDYFSGDANLDVIVTENTDSIYSGVKTVDYTVTKDGVEGESQNLHENDTPSESTLEELRNDHSRVQKPIVVAADAGSKRVTVKVTAQDFAGNSSNPITTEKSFVIDPVKPVVTQHGITSGTSKYNNSYYNTDVTITTKIKERFLDSEDASFTIVKDGVEQKVSIKQLGEDSALRESLGLKEDQGFSCSMTDETSDESETTVTLVFEKDGVYSISVNAMDRAGNVTNPVDAVSFTIDKVAPQAKMIYYSYGSGETFAPGTEKNAPTYLGEKYNSFDAVLQVVEKNFSDGSSVNGTYTLTAKDSKEKAVETVAVDTYMEQAKSYDKWTNSGIGEDTHAYALNFGTDANYSFGFTCEDLAGNPVSVSTEYVTLDKTKPTGSITVNGLVNGESQKSWLNYFLSGITFGLFGNTSANATMTSDDATAGVKSTQYLVSETYLAKDQVAARTDWTTYARAIGLAANRNVIVYEKVVDKADNTEYYSSDSFVMDNVDPAPVVTITPSSPAWGKGVYSANDNPGFNINVTDPIVNNAYSGLKEITYKIVNGTTGVVETGTLATIGKSAHQQSWTGHVNIDPNKFYSNDVQVTVTASDWSTNDATSETAKLKVDNKAPIVKFSFDKSDVQNGKYYKNNKTLTITVDERNFDKSYTPKVTSTAGGGYSFSGWSTNGEISTGTVTFSGDSDYTVTFDCYDLAGNKSNTEKLEEFTVDKTNPTISVSYDNNSAQNGNYYKATRTATITITEHNFRAGDVRVTTTASNGSAPGVSGWSTSGDRHTATVYFGSDADYTFDISYVDLAGNAAADYAQDKFTVDLTKPSLEITGVQNKSANKGTVAPIIKISDTNFIANGVTLTLTGANKGKVNTSNMITTASAPNGEIITFLNFASGMDDIYTLTAKAVDKAGNDTTQSITFSVNRDGSTYVINDSTKKLLEKGFTNNPQDIVIQEINVDTLEFIELSYSKDGKIVKLTEGKDFKVVEEGAEGQWKKYTYTVFADCFDEEGEYSINISSTDRAENVNNNKVQSVNVDFVVDKTSPVMAVSNLENRGRYKENSHEYTLNVKDNTSLVSVAIYLDDELFKTYELIDGKLVNVDDPSDVLEMDNGKVYLTVDSKNTYQKIKLVSTDAAGNVSETEDYNVLVTANNWVQFYMNKPLFYGTIAVLVILIGVIFFIIWKRRKDEDQKKAAR